MYNNEVNFGLDHPDHNWKLLQYLDNDTLSKFPLTDFQIDRYSDINKLNWEILSTKELPGWIFVKYKDKINWLIFLRNGHPKEINYLLDVQDIMQTHASLFFEPQMKKAYYTEHFISAFPEFIDWNWCAENIKLTDHILLRNWHRFCINKISKYQTMSEEVIRAKKYVIKWEYASKTLMSEKIMREVDNLINWEVLCEYQTLSIAFIEDYIDRIKNNKRCSYAIARYQKLTDAFILKHASWLPLNVISNFQDLSIDFIKQNQTILNMELLSLNEHYNKDNTIQILCSPKTNRWYIIDAPIVKSQSPIVTYCIEIIE